MLVLASDLVVGDIIKLNNDMNVPADCVMISGDYIITNESSINPK